MNDEEEFKIEQYKQCYEDQRQLWILFWRIPTIAVTIAAAIFAAVFIYLWPKGQWIESGTVFLIGHILTFILAYVAHKHRYFGAIWAGTLTKIEESIPLARRIQRTTSSEREIRPGIEYWFSKTAKWHQSPSGENMLIGALVLISLISLGFSMYAFFKQSPCSFYIAFPSWLLVFCLWLLFSGFNLRRSQ
jgi:membrane protein YdbS with pleckstrin-like domain